MNNDFIPNIEPTPVLQKKECRFFAVLLTFFLKYSALFMALGAWYVYDFFYGIASFLLFYLVIGIIRSKLLHASVPKAQQEYSYTDSAIAAWYIKRVVICE
jgi:uncharacterized membrane protein